jgi:hypothetical protein
MPISLWPQWLHFLAFHLSANALRISLLALRPSGHTVFLKTHSALLRQGFGGQAKRMAHSVEIKDREA